MKVLILRSRRLPNGEPPDAYAQEFDTAYAERVIANLVGEEDFCSSCGPDCVNCRRDYDRRFAGNIAAVIDLPAVLGHLLETPGDFVPDKIPPHDILLAIGVHEQILLALLERLAGGPTRGVVVPLEAPDWISPSAKNQAEEICRDAGIEISLPKPFCDFAPPPGSVLDEFRRKFCIGKPEVELSVQNGSIEKAHVKVSAACGATYYIARWMTGKRVDDDLKYDVIARRLHSYPCTASMKWDNELGDTVMHVAGKAHYEILRQLGDESEHEPEMIASPIGVMVHKPLADRENIRNIEQATEAILERLATDGSVSLESLRTQRKISPAAAYTAVLILTQQGRVRTEGNMIVPA